MSFSFNKFNQIEKWTENENKDREKKRKKEKYKWKLRGEEKGDTKMYIAMEKEETEKSE